MTGLAARVTDWAGFRRPRLVILSFAVPILILKLIFAATTYGTNDIFHWGDFSQGVRSAGPVGIYGLTFAGSFYNHPPLIGYFLWLVNGIGDLGIPYRFTIRAVASLADVASALVLFELLRSRRSLAVATTAAVLLAISPVLVVISGFHGNTDPVFALLTLLSAYLLVDRRNPAVSGIAIALAVGIKIIPFVVIPALLIYAVRQSRRSAAGFIAGFAVTFAVTWGPALFGQFRAVRLDVIGYGGLGYSWWGVMQFGHWLGDPAWVAVVAGPGRTVLVGICALVPAVAVWRRPGVILPAVAWSLIVFLALATAFGTQYLVWPLAACYLISVSLATVYSFSAGLILVDIYTRWSGGLPWYRASASEFTGAEKLLLLVPWTTLVLIAVQASRVIFERKVSSAARRADRRAATPKATVRSVAAAAQRSGRTVPVASDEVLERKPHAAQDE